jgi:beta-mannosidase
MLRTFGFLFFLNAMSSTLADAQVNSQPIRQALVTGQWAFRQAHKGDWKPTTCPTSVHTALLANGLIEDPFYRDNEEKLQWIEREDWEFQTTFEVSADLLKKQHIELVFKGLDTYAQVYVNDSLVLESDNMFRTWRADVKRFLKSGTNHLHVYFESALNKTAADWKTLGYELPGGQRTMSRKAQFHYGWDWGPRFVGAGILARPQVEAWDEFVIENLHFATLSLSPENARVVARFRYRSDVGFKGTVTFRDGKSKSVEDRQFMPGVHEDTMWVDIKNPKLWWTHDLGEQHLYDFGLEIKKNVQLLEKQTARVGLRTIELVTEKDAAGETFFFRLNGVPVFARGANYIPQDIFQDRVTGQHYRQLIDDVLASNMNMLRVWGGGIYEDDTFYQLCDAHGILIWQDFMYACAMYPGNGRFLKNAAAEAYQQIERLRQHPCIALWCGNNENDEAWHNWGWQMQFNETQRAQLWRDYKTLFGDVLATYVRNYAGGVPYWESSPRYGRYNPKSLTEGDNHYWGVWHDEEPFQILDKKIPRFMSEYGFQSFPEWRTIASFTTPADRQLESKVMLLHQKHPRGNALIAEYTRRDFHAPRNFEDFVYVSQLVQAEGMRTGIEAHRRHKPYCMGTLYWQLNDVWPVASWASRDYFGRWKALQYTVRDVFSPVVALPFFEKDVFKVFAVNDLAAPVATTLQVRALDFDGSVLFDTTQTNLSVPTDSSTLLWQKNLRDILGKTKPTQAVIEVTLRDSAGQVQSRRLWYGASPKDLKLPKTNVEISVQRLETNGYELTLRANRLAKNVYLQTEADGFFEDNYFDLLPNEPRTIRFRTQKDLGDGQSVFKIKTLVETED